MVPRFVVMGSSPELWGRVGRAWPIHKPWRTRRQAGRLDLILTLQDEEERSGSKPIRPHLPVAPPAGEVPAAELQHDARVDRIEARHARGPLHQIALRAARAG